MSVLQHSAHLSCVPTLLQELENLRKQAEIIPQLMAECESVTEKLQVGLKQLQQLQQQLQSSSSSSLRGDVRRERSGGEDLGAHTCVVVGVGGGVRWRSDGHKGCSAPLFMNGPAGR